eukprot:TRINITY_DN8215_c0_g1_i1.p1 TRINITY_DN8215_c0_g1~~TRINITY_DN8215_c0_g1_i1.p1  ORF type:complete len:682 (+),score=96.09 TRINITY_DN8215_c0_g1_i1:87-2048(+)
MRPFHRTTILISVLMATMVQTQTIVEVSVTIGAMITNVDHKVPAMGCLHLITDKLTMGKVVDFRNSKMTGFNGTIMMAKDQRIHKGNPACWIDQDTITEATKQFCRNCRVLTGPQTYDVTCWSEDNIPLIYEVFNPTPLDGTFSFDDFVIEDAVKISDCISPFALSPSNLQRCDDMILPDCFAPGNGSGGMYIGSQIASESWPCECLCHSGWTGPNCDNPPSCDEIDLSDPTTCGGAACDGIAPGFKKKVLNKNMFGGVVPFTTSSQEVHFKSATDSATMAALTGDVCDTNFKFAPVVYSCPGKGKTSTLADQLCVAVAVTDAPDTPTPPASTTCDTVDLSSATTCGGKPCDGITAAFQSVITNDNAMGDVAGGTKTTEAVFTAGNTTTDPLCDMGFKYIETEFECPAPDGTAVLSGQICESTTKTPAPDTPVPPVPPPTDAPTTAAPSGATPTGGGGNPTPSDNGGGEDSGGDDKFIMGLIIGLAVAMVCCIWLVVMWWRHKKAKIAEEDFALRSPEMVPLAPVAPPEPEPMPDLPEREPTPPVVEEKPPVVEMVRPPSACSSEIPTPPDDNLVPGEAILSASEKPSSPSPSSPGDNKPLFSRRSTAGSNTMTYTGALRAADGSHVPFSSPVAPTSSRRKSASKHPLTHKKK